MFRLFNSFAPVVALIALAMFTSRAVRADDAPAASQPSATGSIVVTVLDSGGNPVEKASLKLHSKKKKSEAGADDAAKAKALAAGKTDEDGKFTFSGLTSGTYKINASYKKTGSKSSGTVVITDEEPNGKVTITFAAPDGGTGGATTAPSPAASAAPAAPQ
ncbi:MAG TPA: carboxypeptidase-like regulatory domain-containing protein [Tepidisphaeraceae bacterium]|jgi:hypothetical protein